MKKWNNLFQTINNVIRLNVTQLVDDGGNALPPSLSGFSGVIFKEVFPIGGNAAISVNSGSKELKGLEGQSSIASIGTYPTPICYSQTSSNQYTEVIPLSGSGNISIYDNSGSAVAKTFYAISAMGSGSDGTTTFPSTTFSTILQPSEIPPNIYIFLSFLWEEWPYLGCGCLNNLTLLIFFISIFSSNNLL